MKIKKHQAHKILLICLLLIAFCVSSFLLNRISSKPVQITYSLYPYLRNIEDLQTAVETTWKEIDPSVELVYVDYNCYKETPDSIDVFFYDVYRESELISLGYLQPINEDDINDVEDILLFALEGISDEGALYGIPALLCADFLIYGKEDSVLSECISIDDLIDQNYLIAADESNIVYYYLETLMDCYGTADYIKDSEISNIDETAKNKTESLFSICEPKILGEGTDAAVNAFNEDEISGYIGFSESMAGISDISGVGIKQISFYGDKNTEVFYCDAVGINSSVKPGSREYEKCLELANYLASGEYVGKICLSNNEVQYYLPARLSVFNELSSDYPLYDTLKAAVLKGDGLFRLGNDANVEKEKLEKLLIDQFLEH